MLIAKPRPALWHGRAVGGHGRGSHARSVDDASSPKCWLLGSGPGSKELLTLKAVRLLEEADCVVYDDLAAEGALDYCRPGAELVYVGKRAGRPSVEQVEIDSILLDKCKNHLQVVRLKGGCPTVFGRLANEIRALAEANIDFEVVPGVTAMCAAAAELRVPLTSVKPVSPTRQGPGRLASRSTALLVLSGHTADAMDWSDYSPDVADTLVLYMGGNKLSRILRGLVSAGWPAHTQV